MSPPDYLTLARSLSRAGFIARHPHLFLVGMPSVVEPTGPQRTMANAGRMVEKNGKLVLRDPSRLVVRAVQKSQDAFPHMITVGRASNNDVVLRDVQVSKFHAWFRPVEGRDGVLELSDAESRNGTFVDEVRLQPKTPTEVTAGARLRFGTLEVELLDAARTWDEVAGAS